MKKSKILGFRSGEWLCTHVGVASVQSVFTRKVDDNGRKIKSKSPGHRNYYYIFERLTHDDKALKMIRLTAAQARLVFRGQATVEEISQKKERRRSQIFSRKVSYSYCD